MAGKGITKTSDGLNFVEDHFKFGPEEDIPSMGLVQCANSTFYTADGADLEDHLSAVPKRRDSSQRKHHRSKSASSSKHFFDYDDQPGSDPLDFKPLKRCSSVPNISASSPSGEPSTTALLHGLGNLTNLDCITPPASPNPDLAGHADIGALGLAAYSAINEAWPDQIKGELTQDLKQEEVETKAQAPQKSLAKLVKETIVVSITASAQQAKHKDRGKDVGQDSDEWPSSSDDEEMPSTAVRPKSPPATARSRLSKRDSLKRTMAVNVPKEMTDVGKYSYAALCGVNLYTMFGDSAHNKEYFDKFVKSLTEHLQLGPQVEKSIRCIVHGEGMDHSDPFVDSLMQEAVIADHTSQVVAHDLVSLSLTQGCYDARMRVLIKQICHQLRVGWLDMKEYEELVVETLEEKEHEATEEELKEKASQQKKRKAKRYAMVGLASAGTGILLGLTGGLAAPLIAGAAAAIIGGGAAALSTTAAIAVIGSLFGVAGAGLGAYKMKKRAGDLEEFEFESLSSGRSLHLTIAVTGWITDENPDYRLPWLGLDNSSEQYTLRYESKYLRQLGQAMEDYIVSAVGTAAAQEALKHTVLAGLIGSIAWPATIVSVAGVLDNPWNVCAQRAVNTGRQMADVLLDRQQGQRPVTLIGFSLGSRVIFHCLQEMANRKKSEGIIEDVIMLGSPVTADPKEWEPLSRVVAGSIINGYCRTDWLLKFLYRTASVQFSIAGLEPVKWDNRRMHNMDLTEAVDGHLDYLDKIDYLLDLVGIAIKPRAPYTIENVVAEKSLQHWVNAHHDREKAKRTDKPGMPPLAKAMKIKLSQSGVVEGDLEKVPLPDDEEVQPEVAMEAEELDLAPQSNSVQETEAMKLAPIEAVTLAAYVVNVGQPSASTTAANRKELRKLLKEMIIPPYDPGQKESKAGDDPSGKESKRGDNSSQKQSKAHDDICLRHSRRDIVDDSAKQQWCCSMSGTPTDPSLFNIPQPAISDKQKRHGLYYEAPVTFLQNFSPKPKGETSQSTQQAEVEEGQGEAKGGSSRVGTKSLVAAFLAHEFGKELHKEMASAAGTSPPLAASTRDVGVSPLPTQKIRLTNKAVETSPWMERRALFAEETKSAKVEAALQEMEFSSIHGAAAETSESVALEASQQEMTLKSAETAKARMREVLPGSKVPETSQTEPQLALETHLSQSGDTLVQQGSVENATETLTMIHKVSPDRLSTNRGAPAVEMAGATVQTEELALKEDGVNRVQAEEHLAVKYGGEMLSREEGGKSRETCLLTDSLFTEAKAAVKRDAENTAQAERQWSLQQDAESTAWITKHAPLQEGAGSAAETKELLDGEGNKAQAEELPAGNVADAHLQERNQEAPSLTGSPPAGNESLPAVEVSQLQDEGSASVRAFLLKEKFEEIIETFAMIDEISPIECSVGVTLDGHPTGGARQSSLTEGTATVEETLPTTVETLPIAGTTVSEKPLETVQKLKTAKASPSTKKKRKKSKLPKQKEGSQLESSLKVMDVFSSGDTGDPPLLPEKRRSYRVLEMVPVLERLSRIVVVDDDSEDSEASGIQDKFAKVSSTAEQSPMAERCATTERVRPHLESQGIAARQDKDTNWSFAEKHTEVPGTSQEDGDTSVRDSPVSDAAQEDEDTNIRESPVAGPAQKEEDTSMRDSPDTKEPTVIMEPLSKAMSKTYDAETTNIDSLEAEVDKEQSIAHNETCQQKHPKQARTLQEVDVNSRVDSSKMNEPSGAFLPLGQVSRGDQTFSDTNSNKSIDSLCKEPNTLPKGTCITMAKGKEFAADTAAAPLATGKARITLQQNECTEIEETVVGCGMDVSKSAGADLLLNTEMCEKNLDSNGKSEYNGEPNDKTHWKKVEKISDLSTAQQSSQLGETEPLDKILETAKVPQASVMRRNGSRVPAAEESETSFMPNGKHKVCVSEVQSSAFAGNTSTSELYPAKSSCDTANDILEECFEPSEVPPLPSKRKSDKDMQSSPHLSPQLSPILPGSSRRSASPSVKKGSNETVEGKEGAGEMMV